MAVVKFFPIISNSPGNALILSAGQSQAITIGNRVLVRIVSTQGVNIRFGSSVASASASDMYLPPNTPEIFDMGDQNDSLCIYNSSTGSASVWINPVSKA